MTLIRLLQRHLRDLLSDLSPPARAVLLLRFQEDLDPTDIAQTLDMPINTVKSHLKRSLETMREKTIGMQSSPLRGQFNMSQEIESRIRAALRPVAPSDEFSQKLLARLIADQPRAAKIRAACPSASARPLMWWLTASLAACLILAVGIQQHLEQQRLQQSGLEARREVVEALRMTSEKLNLAYEAVKNQSTSLSDEKSGV